MDQQALPVLLLQVLHRAVVVLLAERLPLVLHVPVALRVGHLQQALLLGLAAAAAAVPCPSRRTARPGATPIQS